MQALLFALFYYLAFLALDGVIFLMSHVPPRVINLDDILLKLGDVERFLAWPRILLRKLWPGETIPETINSLLAVLNALIWGGILAGLKRFWDNARK